MTKRSYFIYVLIATSLIATSCKSCRDKFAKKDTTAEKSGIDTSMYAGLEDTSSSVEHSVAQANTPTSTTDNNSASSNPVAGNNSSSLATNTSSTSSSNSQQQAQATPDIEKETASKSVSHNGRSGSGFSRSIYDGVNDQQERYVVRKAEGYNDAYYIDDYNGTNKFYEDHYKKASKLEKPIDQYIDKSMNLPSTAYTTGPTQKTVDAQLNQNTVVEEPKVIPAKTGSGTGTIGISKKSLEKKNK